MVEEPETMSARDVILGRIHAVLADEPETSAPRYELWPEGTWQPPNDLFARFAEELQRVQGESKRCATWAEARQLLRELHGQLGAPRTALVDHPLCRALGEALPNEGVQTADPAMDRTILAAIPLAVMPAEFLLADTGTAVLLPRSHAERLLCYLPEVAVVVAGQGSVHAHLSDVWDALSAKANDPATRGEILLVTGPSRTADIEKKLVLGAHGPKRLWVVLVDEVVPDSIGAA
jgi:L-lactate dehydrogenase complex protein LldG